jgi:hypothetical protein
MTSLKKKAARSSVPRGITAVGIFLLFGAVMASQALTRKKTYVKQHLLHNTGCVLAISVWNDPDAQRRAENLGAKALVDKANLYGDLNRWIKSLCTSE